MLNQILNRFRGQVRLRVEAAFPERVLNQAERVAKPVSEADLAGRLDLR